MSVLIELLNDSNKPNQRKTVFELLSKHLTQSKTSYDSLTEFASLLIEEDYTFISLEFLELLIVLA